MTFDDRAVHGYLVTWNNTQPIADSLLFEWNLRSPPGAICRAVGGARFNNALMALPVRLLARSSTT